MPHTVGIREVRMQSDYLTVHLEIINSQGKVVEKEHTMTVSLEEVEGMTEKEAVDYIRGRINNDVLEKFNRIEEKDSRPTWNLEFIKSSIVDSSEDFQESLPITEELALERELRSSGE